MFQKKDGDLPEPDGAAPEERAYEDNWYRSLKALSEQRETEDTEPGDAHAETTMQDPPDETNGPVQDAVEEPDRVEAAEATPADVPVTPEDRERLVSEEFETRAGQLLERLRSIQHLGER